MKCLIVLWCLLQQIKASLATSRSMKTLMTVSTTKQISRRFSDLSLKTVKSTNYATSASKTRALSHWAIHWMFPTTVSGSMKRLGKQKKSTSTILRSWTRALVMQSMAILDLLITTLIVKEKGQSQSTRVLWSKSSQTLTWRSVDHLRPMSTHILTLKIVSRKLAIMF